MKLALVEDVEGARAAPADAHVVALEPDAVLALEASGRRYVALHELVDDMEVEAAGLSTFPLADLLCSEIDELAALGLGEAAGAVSPGRWHIFPLKVALDQVLVRGFVIRTVLERTGATSVWTDGGPLFGQVASLVAGSLRTRASGLERPPSVTAPRVPSSSRRRAVRRLLACRPVVRGHVRVLCLDRMYGVQAIAREARRRGCRVGAWRAPAPFTAQREPLELTGGVTRMREPFVAEGVDLWPAAEAAMRRLLGELPASLAAYEGRRRTLGRANAVLCSVAAFPLEKAACAAARHSGVPVVVSRHGELGTRDVPIVARQDPESVDAALCWGTWERDWLLRHAPRPLQTHVVGSPFIEEAAAAAPGRADVRRFLGVNAEARVILYVPTGLSGRDWYGSRRTPLDVSLFRHQTGLLEGLAALEGARVFVKEHSAGGPTLLAQWCRLRGLDEVRVLHEPAFGQLIHFADDLVLDFPSTTLVQALFGRTSISVIDHQVLAWEPGVREHLKQHGVFVGTTDEVAERLRQSTRSRHDDLAREPLVAGGPGTAAHRAADALIEIATGA